MFLDPNRDGLEMWYDNKLRNLVGSPEEVVDYIVKFLCGEAEDWVSSKELYERGNVIVFYKGKKYEQYTIPYLDCNGIGGLYARLFHDIGFEYKKLDVGRIDLRNKHR